MFFARKRALSEVEAGTVYFRDGTGQAVEYAEVVEIAPDGMGISHVRYRVTHANGTRAISDGLRVLALSCFAERFRKFEQAA